MKITSEDYDILRDAMTPIMDEFPRKDFPEVSGERYRWDVLRVSRPMGINFLTQRLYKYLDDSHVDTALRRIVKTHNSNPI